ncbi:MAG: hypothetical protein QG589_217 [Patescibacteria group bacterium]|nr:hypothetical protein [Patescibacteria group bacterium]
MNVNFEGLHDDSDEVNSAEVLEAAAKLVESSELLRNDEYTQRVLRGGGKVDTGNVVDIGDFLVARQAVLEEWEAKGRMAAMEEKNKGAYDAAVREAGSGVGYSVRPELDK